ncbi:MAG: alpha/beta hydrolase [Rhizobacter sp.]|nr:alpha/beta hydrolase [Rhizobacter sp.]
MTRTEVFPVTEWRVLLLPGWLNSDAAHWQSRWEQQHGDQRVEQDDWLWPKRGDWMARLEDVLLQSDAPAVLVAHSLGCQLVSAWAAHSQHTHRVRAAMLVALPDVERDDMPPQLALWRPMLRQRMPFKSLAIVSSDDPYCAPDRAAQLAADWGSELMSVGARAHINGESGLGDWPEGRAMLRALIEAAV